MSKDEAIKEMYERLRDTEHFQAPELLWNRAVALIDEQTNKDRDDEIYRLGKRVVISRVEKWIDGFYKDSVMEVMPHLDKLKEILKELDT